MKKPTNPKLGTAYRVTRDTYFKKGDIAYLVDNDGANTPWFSSDKNYKFKYPLHFGNCYQIAWSELEPIPPLTEAKYKIRVNLDESRQIQEICFKQGIGWNYGSRVNECKLHKRTENHGWIYIQPGYLKGWDLPEHEQLDDSYGSKISAQDFIRIYGAKREFKVGDRVRVVKADGECTFQTDVGKEFIIEEIDQVVKTADTKDNSFSLEDLELITPVEEKEPEADYSGLSTHTTCTSSGGTLTLDSMRDAYLATRLEPMKPIYIGWDFGIKTTGSKPKKGWKSMLQDIPKKLKRLMDKGLQARFQLGRLNDRLELTSEGQSDLMDYLADLHADELGKRAIADLKEAKKVAKDCDE